MDNLAAREMIKALIAEGAIALVCIYALMDRLNPGTGRKWIHAGLLILALASVAAYFEFGALRYGKYMNPHDVYHYYIGAKYAPEIGYSNLYNASLLAESELGGRIQPSRTIRNLDTISFVRARTVLDQSQPIRARFSDERWNEFKKDIAYFRDIVPRAKWEDMLRDKGYNGTPVWSMAAGALASQTPTSSAAGMDILVALDVILIALMLGFVCTAFGPRVALIALVFFGINFTMSFVHIKGAFLRLDWLASIVISMCLVRMGRYGAAGGVLAYAAAARVFPLIFVFGLGATMIWHVFETRRIHPRYLWFFGMFTLVGITLTGISALLYGVPLWQEFLSKIGGHNDDISTTRVGFKYIFLWPFAAATAKASAFEARQPLWWAIQTFVLVMTSVAARKLKDHEALALGFVPVFFLTAPTFYYFVMLVVPLLFFLPRLDQSSRLIGACLYFAFCITGYILHQFHGLDFRLSFYLSCLILGLGLYQLTTVLTAEVTAEPAELPANPSIGYHLAWVLPTVLLFAGVSTLFLLPAGKSAVATAQSAPAPTTIAAPPAPTLERGEVALILAGDVMLSRNVAKRIADTNSDFRYPFALTAPFTQQASIAFCNLECPVSGRGEPVIKNYLFNAPPESIDGLLHAGFDVVSVANNHILDYGPVAMQDTLDSLNRARIAYVGISDNEAPQKHVTILRNGLRVGFLAYADAQSAYAYAKEFLPFESGPAKAIEAVIAKDIAALKSRVDIVVVSVHWGTEYNTEPDQRQRELGRFVIDQGATIVAGHHPHVLQPEEWYRGGLILYSLGNFVFDQHTRPATRLSRLYRLILSKQGIKHAEFLPLEITPEWQPRPTADDFQPLPSREANPQRQSDAPAGPARAHTNP